MRRPCTRLRRGAARLPPPTRARTLLPHPTPPCSEAGEVPPFQFVEINGLRLPSPHHAYSALYEVGG